MTRKLISAGVFALLVVSLAGCGIDLEKSLIKEYEDNKDNECLLDSIAEEDLYVRVESGRRYELLY